MNKIIKFFSLMPMPSISIPATLSEGQQLNEMFSQIFDKSICNNGPFIFPRENNIFRFDILETDSNYLFGTCCKEEDFKKDVLLQRRNVKSNETGPYIKDPNALMERFTYFIIDYNTCKLASIYNKNIPSIHKILAELISSTAKCNRIDAYPVQINNIDDHMKKYTSCKEIILRRNENSQNEYTDTLRRELEGSCELGKYKISISVKSSETGLFSKLLNLSRKNKDYSDLSFIALNEYGLEDTINLLETYLTKRVPIELTGDIVFNKKEIKDILVKELHNAFYK